MWFYILCFLFWSVLAPAQIVQFSGAPPSSGGPPIGTPLAIMPVDSGTTYVNTFTTNDPSVLLAPAGSLVGAVFFSRNGSSPSFSSVTDTNGNVYNLYPFTLWTGSWNYVLATTITTADLPIGSTWKATLTAAGIVDGSEIINAFSVQGIPSAVPSLLTASPFSNSSLNTISISTGVLPSANMILFGFDSGSTLFSSFSSNFTAFEDFLNTGFCIDYTKVSATTSVTFTPTWAPSQGYQVMVAGFSGY